MEIFKSRLHREEEDWVQPVHFLLDRVETVLEHLDLNLRANVELRLVCVRWLLLKVEVGVQGGLNAQAFSVLLKLVHHFFGLMDTHRQRM